MPDLDKAKARRDRRRRRWKAAKAKLRSALGKLHYWTVRHRRLRKRADDQPTEAQAKEIRRAADMIDARADLVDAARKREQRAESRFLASRAAVRRARQKRMSEHFDVSEFACKDGTPVPRRAYGGLRRLCRTVLEPMRDEFGAATINSGYRHRAYNASIGGASQSQHVYDDTPDSVAADVTFERGNPKAWAEFARDLGIGGVGQYDAAGFVHVDNGPRRDWQG